MAVLALLVIGAGSFVGIRWFAGRDDPTLPTTTRALAAAAHRHMPAEAKLVRVREGLGNTADRFVVMLDYEIGGRPVSFSLEPNKQLPWMGDFDCPSEADAPDICEIRTLDDGTKAAVAHLTTSGKQGTGVSTKRADGEVVSVWVWPSPTVSDLPVSFDILAGMATDPLVGLKTNKKMLELGKDLDVTPMT
ncbi:hypothetical protein [Kribbella sp. NPDC003557]|uniref:hypothetical protein n=1 Tax=Kribbella sp. NPDC003557 TaxID=3154449 RepID=UPI0033B5ED1A